MSNAVEKAEQGLRQFETIKAPDPVVLEALPLVEDAEVVNAEMQKQRVAAESTNVADRSAASLVAEGMMHKERVIAELCFGSVYCIRVEMTRHYSKLQDLCNESRSLLAAVRPEETEACEDVAPIIRELAVVTNQLSYLTDAHATAMQRLTTAVANRRVWTAIAFMCCGMRDVHVPLHISEICQQMDDAENIDVERAAALLKELSTDIEVDKHHALESTTTFAAWKQSLPAILTGARECLELWSAPDRPPVLVQPFGRLVNIVEEADRNASAFAEQTAIELRSINNDVQLLQYEGTRPRGSGLVKSASEAVASVVVVAQDVASQAASVVSSGWTSLTKHFKQFTNSDGSLSISLGLVDEKSFKVVVEHQRYYPFKGWSNNLLPTDRPRYCTLSVRHCEAPGDTFTLGPLERWTDEWRPVDFGAPDGWLYSVDFPARAYPKVFSTAMVRRRLFARPYVVVHNGAPSTLGLGCFLRQGQELRSADGHIQLIHQGDGNVVLYHGSRPLWSTKTDPKETSSFELLKDGNLVLFDTQRRPVWASGTNDKGVQGLAVVDDGRLELRTTDGTVVWSSTSHSTV